MVRRTDSAEIKDRKAGRSWIRTVLVFLALIFIVNLTIQIVTNISYITTMRRQTIQENTNAAEIWAKTVDTELESMNEDLHELLLMIYNNTELRTGSQMMQASLKRSLYDTMSYKMLTNEWIDFFCLVDTESTLYLFNAQNSISGYRITDLKAMTEAYDISHATTFRDKTWDVVENGGECFLIKSVMLGKYVLTEASSLNHYPIDDIASILGDEPSMILDLADRAYCFGNHTEKAEEDLIASDGHFRESGEWITSYAKMSRLNGTLALSVSRGVLVSRMQWTDVILLLLASILSLTLLFLFFLILYRETIRPTRAMIRGINEVQKNGPGYQITEEINNREFRELSDSFNEMSRVIEQEQRDALDRVKKEEEDKLHLLRAQIKPHFYLNAITTISNMTYQNRTEDIRKYCLALSKYMRYMLDLRSDFTTIGEEMTHIANYIEMQQIRFPGSVTLVDDCEEQAKEVRIPLLLMFTIVENSFKHAMDLYREMIIDISCRMDADRSCHIRITDNGPGFSPEVLENRNDNESVLITKNHIGLSNAAYTLQLLFHRSDLISFSNLPEGGACVDILIPAPEYEKDGLKEQITKENRS